MVNSSVDPIELLDQVQSVVLLHWDNINEKCKSLEESLNEINSEKEHLKSKLALSQQRAMEIEQERDRLAQIVNEFHRDLLTSPIYKLIGRLRHGVNVLELSNNSTIRSVASDYNPTANDQSIFDTSIESGSFCSNLVIPKIDEENENVCSSTKSSAQCKAVSSKDPDSASFSTIRNKADIRSENANSLKINESTTGKNYASLNLVTNQTTTQSSAEDGVLITDEDTNSDIELVLSDDENVEPPTSDKKLVVCLPMIEFIPKQEPVSHELSDCDSGTSDKDKSPLGCIICEEIFLSEADLSAHVKEKHLHQYCELKKLAIDFREKPTLLPRLRSREKKSQISNDLRPRTRSRSRETKRSNSEENVEAVNFKKFKQLLPMDIEKNPSVDVVPGKAFVETSVETAVQFDSTSHPKLPLRVTADSSIGGSFLLNGISSKMKNYRCKICDEDFKNGKLLGNHLNRCHVGDERMKTCPSCDHIFQTHQSLLQHQRKSHPDKSRTT